VIWIKDTLIYTLTLTLHNYKQVFGSASSADEPRTRPLNGGLEISSTTGKLYPLTQAFASVDTGLTEIMVTHTSIPSIELLNY
jgi:hypothetical protein